MTDTTLAGVGRRIAARLLDGLVLMPVMIALVQVFGGYQENQPLGMPEGAVRAYWVVLVAYEVLLINRRGQTVGKQLLGIRVVDATTGAVPNLDQAGRRAAPTLVQIVPVLGIIGVALYLPLLWNPRRQGFHDQLASTVVVRI